MSSHARAQQTFNYNNNNEYMRCNSPYFHEQRKNSSKAKLTKIQCIL